MPRAFAGKSGRLGEHHTRWDAGPSVYSKDPTKRCKGEMGQNCMTRVCGANICGRNG